MAHPTFELPGVKAALHGQPRAPSQAAPKKHGSRRDMLLLVGALLLIFLSMAQSLHIVFTRQAMISHEDIVAELRPMVTYLETELTKNGEPPLPLSIAGQMKGAKRTKALFYYPSKDGFALSVYEQMIGKRGYTLYYLSSEDKWYRFRSDLVCDDVGRLFRRTIKELPVIVYLYDGGDWTGAQVDEKTFWYNLVCQDV